MTKWHVGMKSSCHVRVITIKADCFEETIGDCHIFYDETDQNKKEIVGLFSWDQVTYVVRSDSVA